MFAVGVCDLPETGGSTFVLVAGLFVLVAGVIVARWVRESAGRLSVVVAPLVLLGGLVLVPQVADPCETTTTTVAPTTTTTTIALTCAMGGSCAVGDTGPGGGTIFYVDLTRALGSQYFEVACAGWQNNCDGATADPTAYWGCYGTGITDGGLTIGTGEQNTADILAGCLTVGIAADLADDYSHNTLDDWFLPSKDELNQMYTNLHNVSPPFGGFSTDCYWSSSENGANYALAQNFGNGFQQSYFYKDFASPCYVRPVRSF
jgi:hypothetical protein